MHGGGKHAPAPNSCIPHTLPESVQGACQDAGLVVPRSQLCLCCLVAPGGQVPLPVPRTAAQQQQACVVVCRLLLQHQHTTKRVWAVFSCQGLVARASATRPVSHTSCDWFTQSDCQTSEQADPEPHSPELVAVAAASQ